MNTAVGDSQGQKLVPAQADAGQLRPQDEQATPFIGRDELARRLNVHPRTVSRMVERGELPRPCMSDGGRPRWLWSFVVEFCHERHMKQARLGQNSSGSSEGIQAPMGPTQTAIHAKIEMTGQERTPACHGTEIGNEKEAEEAAQASPAS